VFKHKRKKLNRGVEVRLISSKQCGVSGMLKEIFLLGKDQTRTWTRCICSWALKDHSKRGDNSMERWFPRKRLPGYGGIRTRGER